MADKAEEKMPESKKLKCIIADSAAFLKNVDLQNLSERIFTINEVIREIRDSATRKRLAVLPYEIEFREPSTESLSAVSEFSKKTGDYKSLSAVDIRVLALTYQLEKEFGSPENIKLEPKKTTQIVQHSKVKSDKRLVGFYSEPKESSLDAQDDNGTTTGEEDTKMESSSDKSEENENNISTEEDEEEMDEEEMNEEGIEENEDDGGGWITPGNIKKVKREMGCNDEIDMENSDIKCACLTTDFAMQNVLIQMGLHVMSVQGRLIREARNYIQKCFGCNKETHDMEKIFCPSCGNKTLMKISVTIGEDGVIQYHLPKRKKNHNLRGTKFSMPLPKGGRHSDQPYLLTEDQHFSKDRMPQNRDKVNPMDPDYVSRVNPFTQNDVNSRAFHLNLHVKNKQPRNPNETRKKKSGRKK